MKIEALLPALLFGPAAARAEFGTWARDPTAIPFIEDRLPGGPAP
jgi:hypothetical protein